MHRASHTPARASSEPDFPFARLLSSWSDVGAAVDALRAAGIRFHKEPLKNWDLDLLRRAVAALGRDVPVGDLGCAGLHGVRLLESMGFTDVRGIDLALRPLERLRPLSLRLRRRATRLRLERGDLTRTGWPAGAFGALACLSVLEHGVDAGAFLSEAARLLRPGGRLLATVDYDGGEPARDGGGSAREVPPGPRAPEAREGPAEAPGSTRGVGEGSSGPGAPGSLHGLPWHVLDRAAAIALLARAREAGFDAPDDAALPSGPPRPLIEQGGRAYTFLAIGLVRAEG